MTQNRWPTTPTTWPKIDDSLYPRHGHDADDLPHPHPHGKRRGPHTAKKKLRRNKENLRRKRKEFEWKIWEEREFWEKKRGRKWKSRENERDGWTEMKEKEEKI